MWVSATGLVCSVGLSSKTACTAMRCGISNHHELPFRDEDYEPIVGASIEQHLPVDGTISRKERLLSMLSRALLDCIVQAGDIVPEQTALILILPSVEQPGAYSSFEGEAIFDALYEILGFRFEPTLSQVLRQGVSGTAHAIRATVDAVTQKRTTGSLICSVDSLLNATTLLKYQQQGRLKTQRNSDGFVPGEAAACVYLSAKQRHAYSPEILALGFANEPASILNDQPFRCEGLAAAARGALAIAKMTMSNIDFRISDLTGESYQFREQSLLVTKLLRERKENFELWHPAQFTGCTRSVSGLIQLIVLEHAFCNGYAPGRRVLSCCSEPEGERTVMVLQGTNATPNIEDEVCPNTRYAL